MKNLLRNSTQAIFPADWKYLDTKTKAFTQAYQTKRTGRNSARSEFESS
jgi:hypothetical protein